MCELGRKHIRCNYTPKVPDTAHQRKATIAEIVKWEKHVKPWISCLKSDGFELYIQDETIVKRDDKPKRGSWSLIGQKIHKRDYA